MKIKYNVEIPKSDAEDINELYKFVESDGKTMQITYDDIKEAKLRRFVLANVNDKNEFGLEIKRIGLEVYIAKVN